MTQTDPTENSNIPAGFTYLGQFVDHDTFDPNSSLQRMNNLEGFVNFRTPCSDLDSTTGGARWSRRSYDQADVFYAPTIEHQVNAVLLLVSP